MPIIGAKKVTPAKRNVPKKTLVFNSDDDSDDDDIKGKPTISAPPLPPKPLPKIGAKKNNLFGDSDDE